MVVPEFPTVRHPVICKEAIIQQDARRFANTFESAVAPGFDSLPVPMNQWCGRDARFQKRQLIGVLPARAGHCYRTLTFTVFVVSLPRMSMTLTTTVYSPGSP